MADNVSNELIRVDSLIPSQLLDDAADLREFIKKYYEYLNSTNEDVTDNQSSYLISNITEFRDLDQSIDEFIELIRKELGQGISSELFANKSNLYKFAKEIYSSKGSVDSFRLIFRLLFDKEIDFILPKEQILIASDGRWRQDVSIFAELDGDGSDLVGNRITITAPGGQPITFEVLSSRKVATETDVYELFIDRNFNATIEVGSTISDSGITGTVVEALNAGTISKAGTGFKVGQIYNIQNEFSSGASIKITGVNSSGGITSFSFLSFGVGYESPFFTSIASNTNVSSGETGYSISYDSGTNAFTATFTDTHGGFRDSGVIRNTDTNEIVVSWNNDLRYDQDEEVIEDTDTAILYFTMGALCEYDGYYQSNKGFLSDSIYLQDNYYYQNFSYVIGIDEKYSTYSDILKKSVHPAGMIAFGQYNITNSVDISASLRDVNESSNTFFTDSVQMSEQIVLDITLNPSDTATMTDSPVLNNSLSRSFTDTATMSDSGEIFKNVYAIDYFSEDYVDSLDAEQTF